MKALSRLGRKINNIAGLTEAMNITKAQWYDVHDVILLSDEKFENFKTHLLDDYAFFNDNRKHLFIVTNGLEQYLIDTQGYHYARYMGIVLDVDED